jgi:hypothetical protein
MKNKKPEVTALTKEQVVEFMKLVTQQLEKAYRDGRDEGIELTLRHVGPHLTSEQIDAATISLLQENLAKSKSNAA